MTVTKGFDYVLVGGGTAGCVLAARLSEDPACRVFLVEAGPAQKTAGMSDPVGWFGLWATSVDWSYRSVPQAATHGAVDTWPRGTVLADRAASME